MKYLLAAITALVMMTVGILGESGITPEHLWNTLTAWGFILITGVMIWLLMDFT